MVSNINDYNFTIIENQQNKFYIGGTPNQNNLNAFIQKVKEHKIKHIVRLCDPSYDDKVFNDVEIHNWQFRDGDIPSIDIIEKWKNLISKHNEPILVHCVAGLGRAPTLVAIGLIELKINPYESVKMIRETRPGAINTKQLQFILSYKPINKKTNIFGKFFGF
jgi:protein tyrosine phosphatase type 4A